MFRYIFLKLSGFTSKREFSISSSCNQVLMFRPSASLKREYRREPRRTDQSRSQHKRSYSFPSRSPTSCSFLDKEWDKSTIKDQKGLDGTQHKSFHQKSESHSKEGTKCGISSKSDISQQFSTNTNRRTQEDMPKKYHEASCYQDSDRYELEDARPRRSQSELVFNVFDYVTKDVDLTDYLQPNNLKPFGSHDNIYLPMMGSTNNNITIASPDVLDHLADTSEIGDSLDLPVKDSPSKPSRPGEIRTAEEYQGYKDIKPYKELIKRYKELSPPKVEDYKSSKYSTIAKTRSKSLDRETHEKTKRKSVECHIECAQNNCPITIEPPPFLPKREDMFQSTSVPDFSIGGRRNIADYSCVIQTPWPAYSDHIKRLSKKNAITYPGIVETKNYHEVANQEIPVTKKESTGGVTTEGMKRTDSRPVTFKKPESLTNGIPQRRTLSTENKKSMEDLPHTEEPPKFAKSSIYVSRNISKTPVASSLVTLSTNEVNLSSKHSYAKSSKVTKPMEPKRCVRPGDYKQKCFLPSKVRLKPPNCMLKPPYRDCVMPPPCPPRADDCLQPQKKRLPSLKDNDCECFEPNMPNRNPKMKRLNLKCCDEPRVCPCFPPTPCPCPPPIRMDDLATPKEKTLPVYVPQECECVERPEMVDVPLIRLKKVCEPENKCYPPKPCPVPITCEDIPRADDCLEVHPKRLPCLGTNPPCPSLDHSTPYIPKMKRLSLHVPEPPRICPRKLCPPEDAPPCFRADDCAPPKAKALRKIKLTDCPCIDHRMVDVKPLPRLKCRDEPEECVYEDPCMEYPRADWGCWEYYQREPEEKKCQAKSEPKKKKKSVEYKQKRKFNTDSKMNLEGQENKNIRTNKLDPTSKKSLSTETPNTEIKEKSSNTSRCFANSTRINMVCHPEIDKNKLLPNNRASTLPRVTNAKKMSTARSIIMTKTEQEITPPLDKPTGMGRRDSLPTIYLLKDLEEVEKKDKINVTRVENKNAKSNTQYHLKNLVSPLKEQQGQTLSSASVRKLSTVVSRTKKVSSNHRQGEAQISKHSGANKKVNNNESDKKDSEKCKPKKKCDKITKCFGPMFLRNCPERDDRSCRRVRQLVCCEKKKVPNPAFSECMDKEVEPFSNSSQWTCDRQQYGFDPHPKKFSEPLNTAKQKKKFSTLASGSLGLIQDVSGDNAIVDYFSTRYSKPDVSNQSRKVSALTLNQKINNDDGCNQQSRRNSSTLTDLIGSKRDDKEVVSSEEKCPKLLNQKSSFTIAGVNSRKMSTQRIGNGTLQFNSSRILRTQQSCENNTSKKNFSILTNTNSNSTNTVLPKPSYVSSPTYILAKDSKSPQQRSLADDSPKNGCKFPKKKACPKFRMENCPEKVRTTCRLVPPTVICNQRAQAPYPSFSELMDDEMENKLTECPIENEKIRHLQPGCPVPFDKQPRVANIEHQQGRIDPQLEEKCIRERLCMQNKGLTQDCSDFGQYLKPMRSKNFFKERNKDCDKIEELKKVGRWPPKDDGRRYHTKVSNSQTRSFCSSSQAFKYHTLGPEESDKKKAKKMYNSKLQAPNNSENDSSKEGEKELRDPEEPCKYANLRNVQWRINNFQRWHPLCRCLSYSTKKYHTCSKLKYRDLTSRYKQFCTSVKKSSLENLSASIQRGVVCSKLKNNRFEKINYIPKHLSISTLKTPVDYSDTFVQRRISTTMASAKNNKYKNIKFPLYPKPIKKFPKFKIPNCPAPMKPTRRSPNTTSEKKASNLQPQYPYVPEIETSSYQRQMEPSTINQECLIHLLKSKAKKSKSYDCSAVERPFIQLNSASLQTVRSNITECPNQDEEREIIDCPPKDTVPCLPCGEVFMSRGHMRGDRDWGSDTPSSRRVKCPKFKCPKFPLPDNCEEPPSRLCQPVRARRACAPTVCPSPVPLSLWQRIVNYFKARPNCPAPDEWKKRALREKAEKAAKAAGLYLCDPKDLPQNVSKATEEEDQENHPKPKTPKTSRNSGCFPDKRNPCKMYKRYYSNKVNWESCSGDDSNKKMDTKKEKQVSQVFIDELTPPGHESNCIEEDASQKCPDPMFENVLNQAILSKNSLDYLERPSGPKDECLSYSLRLNQGYTSCENILDGSLNHSDGVNECKHLSNLQDYFGKVDTLSEIAYEELERAKTRSLVNELNKLLVDYDEPVKKN